MAKLFNNNTYFPNIFYRLYYLSDKVDNIEILLWFKTRYLGQRLDNAGRRYMHKL